MLIGYHGGRPVCSSHVAFAGGVAGLYNISTADGFRRRGFGTAITLAAMRLARDLGYRTALLQASEMGEPVYRRIGYRTEGEFALYSVEP
jgi:ribosomal protein S18 acetylase RimI-like enzyme